MKAHNITWQLIALASLLMAGSVQAGSGWSSHGNKQINEYPSLVPSGFKDTIVQATPKGELMLLDRAKGKTLWRHRTGLKFSAGPSSDGHVIVAATMDGRVVAFSHKDGVKLWETQLENLILAAPTLGGRNTVLVQLADGTLQALYLSDGTPRWSVSRVAPALMVRSGASALVNDDDVYVGFPNGRVLSINIETGGVNWERDLGMKLARTEIERLNDIIVTPQIFGNTLVVLNAQGRLIALSRQSGTLLWEAPSMALKGYCLNASGVYAVNHEGHLVAFDRVTGSQLWENTSLKNLSSGVALMGNRLVVGDKEGRVYSVNVQSGQTGNFVSVGAEVISTPLVQGTQVIVSSKNGRVDAFNMPA